MQESTIELQKSSVAIQPLLQQHNVSGSFLQSVICKMETLRFNIPCENVKYLFSDWELDVVSINKNNFLTEYEVKISRSDFKADAKKKKWIYYTDKNHWFKCANYFYYVCPKDLIKVEEIPSFAGLIYVDAGEIITVKKAPRLHKEKHDRAKILSKFCRVMSERKYLGSCRMTYENSKRVSF